MYTRLANPLKNKSFFLFGARGTGKTRLLQQLFGSSSALWVDLLVSGEFYTFSRNPSELRERVSARKSETSKGSVKSSPLEWIVIDEVQRLPELLNEVHSLIESDGLKFALTGSSARKLKRGGANLLAGRAILEHLHPLTFVELEDQFSLEDVLSWGSLPGISVEPDLALRHRQLQSYVETYLREEIREEQIIRRLDPFARFLEAAAQSNGAIINCSKLAREAGTDPKSVSRYFEILQDTLLGFYLEPFHLSIRKRQRQQAKFYFFDIGVKRTLDGTLRYPAQPKTYEWGRAFEHLVILEAIRLNDYYHSDFRFSYLKTQGQQEIDLIIERRGERPWAIEIKSAANPDSNEIQKLEQLAADIRKPDQRYFALPTPRESQMELKFSIGKRG